MSINRFFNHYLNFTTREKSGIIGLLILMALLYFLPSILFVEEDYSNELKAFEQKISALTQDTISPKFKSNTKVKTVPDLAFTPFYFNPNTVESAQLSKFGLPDYIIKRFDKYRKSGAVFRKKEDLLKLYGFKPEWYKKMEPYLLLDEEFKVDTYKNESKPLVKKLNETNLKLELNSADSLQLVKINGIGPFTSSKILRYRKALGGFISLDQLSEVYGLKPEQIESIKPLLSLNKQLIKRLNVNSATFSELNAHPYISGKEANAIIQYRKQHGLYQSVEDLGKVYILNSDFINRVKDYIDF